MMRKDIGKQHDRAFYPTVHDCTEVTVHAPAQWGAWNEKTYIIRRGQLSDHCPQKRIFCGQNCLHRDAVARFSDNREAIQLVILDVIMPKKNGPEAYEEIKKIEPGAIQFSGIS